jgi:hypothetical protein
VVRIDRVRTQFCHSLKAGARLRSNSLQKTVLPRLRPLSWARERSLQLLYSVSLSFSLSNNLGNQESHLEGAGGAVRGAPLKSASPPEVNNDIYHELGERWYNAQDDPIALLRAESRLRNPWIAEELRARFAGRALRILDVGCGSGFLSNNLPLKDTPSSVSISLQMR